MSKHSNDFTHKVKIFGNSDVRFWKAVDNCVTSLQIRERMPVLSRKKRREV